MRIGQRVGLSEKDIHKINAMYLMQSRHVHRGVKETPFIRMAQSKNAVDRYASNHNGILEITGHTSFNTTVYDQPRATQVLFYNSHCELCELDAYEKHAQEVKGWNRVLALAAVNCGNEHNEDLCRFSNIITHPSLYFFPPSYKNDHGFEMFYPPSYDSLVATLINNTDASWPNFEPVGFIDGLDDLTAEYIFLFFDHENPTQSTIAVQVALDFSSNGDIEIRPVKDVSVATDLGIRDKTTLLVRISSHHDKVQHRLALRENTRIGVREAIQTFLDSERNESAGKTRNIEREEELTRVGATLGEPKLYKHISQSTVLLSENVCEVTTEDCSLYPLYPCQYRKTSKAPPCP